MIRISDIISGLKGERKLHPKQQLILAEVLAEVRKYGKCTPWTPFLTSGQPIAWSLLWKGLCSDCWASTSVISLVPASEEGVLLVFANTILTSLEWRWETWLHGPWDPNAGWSSVEQAPRSQMMSVRSAKVNLSPQSLQLLGQISSRKLGRPQPLAFVSPPFDNSLVVIQRRSPDVHVLALYSIPHERKHLEIFYSEFLLDKHISLMIKLVCISNSHICFKKTEFHMETNYIKQFKIIIITTQAPLYTDIS